MLFSKRALLISRLLSSALLAAAFLSKSRHFALQCYGTRAINAETKLIVKEEIGKEWKERLGTRARVQVSSVDTDHGNSNLKVIGAEEWDSVFASPARFYPDMIILYTRGELVLQSDSYSNVLSDSGSQQKSQIAV
ncbi:hypothetical protein BC832DRAFT_541189 [Gaertneriomyces semiglobifer]|nr:hypothetical protein BC832DRAFT_541189 [Gaertneriomyces semiglobifer]